MFTTSFKSNMNQPQGFHPLFGSHPTNQAANTEGNSMFSSGSIKFGSTSKTTLKTSGGLFSAKFTPKPEVPKKASGLFSGSTKSKGGKGLFGGGQADSAEETQPDGGLFSNDFIEEQKRIQDEIYRKQLIAQEEERRMIERQEFERLQREEMERIRIMEEKMREEGHYGKGGMFGGGDLFGKRSMRTTSRRLNRHGDMPVSSPSVNELANPRHVEEQGPAPLLSKKVFIRF